MIRFANKLIAIRQLPVILLGLITEKQTMRIFLTFPGPGTMYLS